MELLSEYEANKKSEKELREIAEAHFKRRIPFVIQKKGLIALVTGKLSPAEQDKVFKGLQPDEMKSQELRMLPLDKLEKMFKEKYNYYFPRTVHRSWMEKILEGKAKIHQLPPAVQYEIGKANPSASSSFMKTFGLNNLPIIGGLVRKDDYDSGRRLSDKLRNKKYNKSKYVK